MLASLPVYQPGRPIEEVARELGLPAASIIKLASNENPLGPSPAALKAMQDVLANIHLYPDGNAFYLKQRLAAKLGVEPTQLILGNGSNELLEFVGHAFVAPGVFLQEDLLAVLGEFETRDAAGDRLDLVSVAADLEGLQRHRPLTRWAREPEEGLVGGRQ